MFRGFYQLTSAMLSHGRRLDVISNNMTNVSTAGYKAERYTDSTAFKEVMFSRVGNKDKVNSEELGQISYILAPDEQYTDFTQGSLEETELPLDFAIEGDGFFAIEWDGEVAYTRAGSFNLDEEGYLVLPGQGRVLDQNRQPIQLATDNIYVDADGGIFTMENRNLIANLGIFAFQDTAALERNDHGLFTGGQLQESTGYTIHHGMVERSNANMVHEMVSMMTAQRAIQSAAEVSKIYDQVMTKDTTELGRL
ncbi:MAG: flagellar hook-basal body protein [Oscillospiraceae bacterium]|nr:flagellar hook-basal body protein [Oscillospiraceae bacterium]